MGTMLLKKFKKINAEIVRRHAFLIDVEQYADDI